MRFEETKLKGSYIITPTPVGDNRGWFARTYCKREFEPIMRDAEWVQINHSFSSERGAIRGMHFQIGEHQEIKLVRCIAGAVYDVIIDIRTGSPTFMQWVGVELNAQNKNMIYVPRGFAHGFQTLTKDAELIYHHSNYYSPDREAGIRYNDQKVSIDWPLIPTTISERDLNHKLIDESFTGLDNEL